MATDIPGREPKDQPRPRTIAGAEGCCFRLRIKWLAARSLGRLSIHVVVPAAMAPSASRCDGASATIAPVTTTSTAAKTRERHISRVGPGKKDKTSVPYRADTHGLSRLITVNRNHCSTAPTGLYQVIPKLQI